MKNLIKDLQEQVRALQLENACLSINKGIQPIYKRLAQLYFMQSKRPLNSMEQDEAKESLKAYAIYLDKLLDLQTLSMVAYDVGDSEWQFEICADIEKLESS